MGYILLKFNVEALILVATNLAAKAVLTIWLLVNTINLPSYFLAFFSTTSNNLIRYFN
jgi:hypothetical protein